MTIYVGTVLYGFCGGEFGRDGYADKRVEAIGTDWVVAREIVDGTPVFARCDPRELEKYTVPEEDV